MQEEEYSLDDLLDVSQSDEDMDIDLTIDDALFPIQDVREQPEFSYPAILISGVRFLDCLRVLKTTRRESFRLFDVWVDLEDGNPPVKQGSLPADIYTFLAMRYLGLTVTLYLAEDAIETLNLRDLSTLENYI